MADPDKPTEKKELSMEVRMAIAFGLMLLVLLGSPYFYKWVMPASPPGAEKKATANVSQPAAKSPAAAPAAKPQAQNAAAAATPEPAAPVAAQAEQKETIETDLFKVIFSNRGAVVESWILKKFTVSCTSRPLELVNAAAAPITGFPFGLWFKSQKPSVDVNQSLFAVKRTPDNLGLDFEFSSGKTTVRKKFRFTRNTYLLDLSTEVTEMGVPVPHELAWRGGFGDMAVPSAAASQHTIYYDEAAAKLVVHSFSDAKNGPIATSGLYSFAGLEDTYFAAVFLPPANTTVEIQTLNEAVPTPAIPAAAPHIGAAVGGDGHNQLSLFVGPKDIDILRSVNPKLEQVVDFGWVGILAKPLFLVVRWVNDHWVHNYGWSIILVTIFINFALLPLKMTSMKSMKKMQALQPQIQAIQAKYKNLSMRDPKRQEQNAETMALYQKHGVNPLGGCMPLLLQMPFLFAFFRVFSIAIEMRGANWLWVCDLSQPESLAIRILPVTMIITQFVLQRMTPATGADPAQQKMMMIMPVVFGVMFYGAQSGLVLYWLTGNLVAIAQQWFFNKTAVAADVAQSVQPKKKPGRK